MWWLTTEPFGNGVSLGPLYCTLAFPLALGSIAVANMVFVALSSNDHTEGDLEWHARYNAWIFITIVVWLGITAIVFLSPLAFRSLRDFLSEQMAIESTHATGIIGGAGIAPRDGRRVLAPSARLQPTRRAHRRGNP